jgi:predicted oxidoreductase
MSPSRAFETNGKPIPGLYAAGEANGRAAAEAL